jgi:multidrug resistance efflux pump
VEILKNLQAAVVKGEGEQKQAAEKLAQIKEENQLDVKVAQLDVRLAHLALKQLKGNDAAAKEVLEIQLDRAGLLVDRIKLKGAAKESAAAADLAAKNADLAANVARQRAIEKERSNNCVLRAPQDGMALFYVPNRGGQEYATVGDRVYSGKKLMVVAYLTQMAFHTHIPEDLIGKVCGGQKAAIRVDAFPKRTFTGTVHGIAEKADRLDEASRYKVTILFDRVNDGLLPGFSGAASIQFAGKAKRP